MFMCMIGGETMWWGTSSTCSTVSNPASWLILESCRDNFQPRLTLLYKFRFLCRQLSCFQTPSVRFFAGIVSLLNHSCCNCFNCWTELLRAVDVNWMRDWRVRIISLHCLISACSSPVTHWEAVIGQLTSCSAASDWSIMWGGANQSSPHLVRWCWIIKYNHLCVSQCVENNYNPLVITESDMANAFKWNCRL